MAVDNVAVHVYSTEYNPLCLPQTLHSPPWARRLPAPNASELTVSRSR